MKCRVCGSKATAYTYDGRIYCCQCKTDLK